VFGLDFIEGPFVCVSRQPRTTTTELWVVVGRGYDYYCCCWVSIRISFRIGLVRIWMILVEPRWSKARFGYCFCFGIFSFDTSLVLELLLLS
jgi:hypothetical protein